MSRRKNISRKKTILVAVVLALVLLIGGMLAYFTDTDEKTNVFTLGDEVDIELLETWDATKGDKIHPGAQVQKVPTIKNKSTTTPAYVFAEVVVPCYDKDGDGTVETALFTLNSVGSAWNLMTTKAIDTENKTITYIYNYGNDTGMTSLAASATTPDLFTSVTLKSDLTAVQAKTASATPNIVINAYGIQTDALSVTAPADIFALFTNN